MAEVSQRYLVRRSTDGNKIDVITNRVNRTNYDLRGRDMEPVCALGLEGRFVAGYIGAHVAVQALETLLTARLIAQHPGAEDVQMLFLGDGAQKAALVGSAEASRLTNVTFLNTVPKQGVARYWSQLDVAITHLCNTDLFKTVITSKLFECVGMGIPVLHGVAGESAEIVQREHVGQLFGPENASELADGLLDLRENTELRRAFANNGPLAAKRYDRNTLAESMLGILSGLVDR